LCHMSYRCYVFIQYLYSSTLGKRLLSLGINPRPYTLDSSR